MLAVMFIVSCLLVFGFYVYVLVQLRREEKRDAVHKRELPEHMHRLEPERSPDDTDNHQNPDFLGIGSARQRPKADASARREAIFGVGLTIGGLAAVVAGIEFLNSLMMWLHWSTE